MRKNVNYCEREIHLKVVIMICCLCKINVVGIMKNTFTTLENTRCFPTQI